MARRDLGWEMGHLKTISLQGHLLIVVMFGRLGRRYGERSDGLEKPVRRAGGRDHQMAEGSLQMLRPSEHEPPSGCNKPAG